MENSKMFILTLREAISQIVPTLKLIHVGYPEISVEEFIDFLIIQPPVKKGVFGMSSNKWNKYQKLVFPNKPSTVRYTMYILHEFGMRYCHHCGYVLPLSEYYKNKSKSYGLNTYCVDCHSSTTKETQAARTAKYRASKINRSALWANTSKIKEIYDNCPEGYQVDHIIPLNGVLVSGLHVEDNLQYLTTEDNISKSNKF